jgi:hypothetical protein
LQTLVQKSQDRAAKFESRLLGPTIVFKHLKFVSGFLATAPEYVSDIFILHGDVLTAAAPFILCRSPKGALFIF